MSVSPTLQPDRQATKDSLEPEADRQARYHNPYLDVNSAVAKNADERILTNDLDAVVADPPPIEPPIDSPPDAAAMWAALNSPGGDWRARADLAKQLMRTGLSSARGKMSEIPEVIATAITQVYYQSATAGFDGQKAKNAVKRHVHHMLSIPVGFWVAFNWWYVVNFTEISFNIMRFPALLPELIRPPVLASLYLSETINYYMLAWRMDAGRGFAAEFFHKFIWNWRPVSFSLVCVWCIATFSQVNVFDVLTDPMMDDDKTSALVGFAVAFGIMGYLKYTMLSVTTVVPTIMSAGVIVGGIVLFLGLILAMVFSALTVPLIGIYLTFFSFFSIIVFGGGPQNLVAAVKSVLTDLRSAPVHNSHPKSMFGKIMNAVFHNFFGIFLATIVVPLLFSQIIDVFKNVSNSGMIITMVIIYLVLLATFVYTSLAPILKIIYDILDTPGDEEPDIADNSGPDPALADAHTVQGSTGKLADAGKALASQVMGQSSMGKLASQVM